MQNEKSERVKDMTYNLNQAEKLSHVLTIWE